jgi:hypothetical protein
MLGSEAEPAGKLTTALLVEKLLRLPEAVEKKTCEAFTAKRELHVL